MVDIQFGSVRGFYNILTEDNYVLKGITNLIHTHLVDFLPNIIIPGTQTFCHVVNFKINTKFTVLNFEFHTKFTRCHIVNFVLTVTR